jgi:hypothetical protein
MTLSKTTLFIECHYAEHPDLFIVMLNVSMLFIECHYAECCCAECRDLFIVMLNAIMLCVIMLNVMAAKISLFSLSLIVCSSEQK